MVLFGSFIGITLLIMCGVGWVIHATQPHIRFSEGYVLTPWRIQWLVFLIPALIGIFVYWSLPESPQFLASVGDTTGALEALRQIYERNGKAATMGVFPIKEIVRKVDQNHHSNSHKANLWGHICSMVKETVILLKPPYLGPILCCCLVQYAIYTV